MTESWGEPDTNDLEHPDGEHLPNTIDLGDGMVLHIDQAALRRAMNSPEVKAQVNARGRALATEANSLAETPGAVYKYVPSDHPNNRRARGRVTTANYQAQVDDAHHSTLLKALSNIGSDPKPDHHEGGQPQDEPEGEAKE